MILVKIKLDHRKDSEMADLVEGSLVQLRQVSRSLYPVVLKSFGLKAALEQLLNQIEEATPEIKVVYAIGDCSGFFSQQEELHIFRIVQEATNNVLKHARCSLLDVDLDKTESNIILKINDNGIGMALHGRPYSGIGMNSMEERAKILGGTFVLQSSKGHGTRITVKIPGT